MKPTILYERRYTTFTDETGQLRNRLLWVTDTGEWTTDEMGEFAGITGRLITHRYNQHGNNMDKLMAPLGVGNNNVFAGTEEWQALCRSSRKTARQRDMLLHQIPVGRWEARV